MKNILLIFSLFLLTAEAQEAPHLKEIENAKPIYGKALKAKDIRDKVILFEYWGKG